jgi:hypothetical protein
MSEQEYVVDMEVFRYGSRDEAESHKVTKVTATQVTIDTGERFTLYGVRIGDKHARFSRVYIEPATEIRRQEFKQSRLERENRTRLVLLRAAISRFVQYDMSSDEVEWLYKQLLNHGMPKVD